MTAVKTNLPDHPMLSVVIPCFNHGKYLQEAIDSVLAQGYANIEIVVVDDGSSDDTGAVAQRNPGVRYLRQSNRGPSAARNTGVRHSTGDVIVFLDADDWLLPHAVDTALANLRAKPECAFVSGGYRLVFAKSNTTEDVVHPVTKDHYLNFLGMNFIGMHATVMYRRWVFSEFEFSSEQRASEDYDMYLRIARKYPVHHHHQIVAAYRIHDGNTSADIPKMLRGVLKVHGKQKRALRDSAERAAYRSGRRRWIDYYCGEILKKRASGAPLSFPELLALMKYSPRRVLGYTFSS